MIERMFTDIAKFMKSQGESHYACKTMLKIPYTGKSRLVLEAVQDSEEIPEPICYPAAEKVPTDNYCHISFDVETTSLGDSSYNRYVVPEAPILSHPSKITGLTVVGNSSMLKRAPAPTVSIYDCLSDFILLARHLRSSCYYICPQCKI